MKILKTNSRGASTAVLLLVIPLLLQLLSCSSTPEKSLEEKKAEIFYATGTSELMDKDYTSALKNLLKAAELNPKDSKIMNNLGMAYFFKKQTALSVKYFERSLELDPKNSDARNNLASVYLGIDELEKAEAEYLKVSADLIYPQQFRIFYNLGLIKLKQKFPREAIKYFHESVKNNEDYCPAHFQLGKIAFSAKQYKEALEEFVASSRGVCYKEPAPLYYQGISLLKLNKPSEAKLKFIGVVEQFPNDRFGELGRQKLTYLKDVEADKPLPGIKKVRKNRHSLLSGDLADESLIDFTNENNKDKNKDKTATAPR